MHTTDDSIAPLILTLRMNDAAATHFTALRQSYFPPERNFLTAHITLFHKLPGTSLVRIMNTLNTIAAKRMIFNMQTDQLLFFGAGVAYRVEAPDALLLLQELASAWDDMLAPQDRKNHFVPHITVQNKVRADVAKDLYAKLSAEFESYTMHAIGLDLWHYQGGPWSHAAGFDFTAAT